MYIETHAHLNFEKFNDDLDETIRRAENAGVQRIINIGIDIKTSRESIELAEKYEAVHASAGIHPHDSVKVKDSDWDELHELLRHPKVVALGEIGLDFYRDYAPRDVQLKVLLRQLEIAVEEKIPIIVHTRNSWQDIYDIFDRNEYKGKLSGVFHCFSGNEQHAQKVLDWGFHISFTGVVTFKNASALNVAAGVPLERLMLETDCPFMAPVPFRGKRSEPAHIPLISDKIAEAKDIPEKRVAEQTTRNAQELFGID
ncbi:YchF/TatD family DNA exonuclease [candidate division KSB1 bacterium]|nr:YchF/TatD family DNA exonuclease [candidate division KSB1 bacterium]